MPGPLDRIVVLDLTRALAGPYCTLMLADMGADVIKIEAPGGGDETRRWGPPFQAGESSYFMSVNRNKRSLTLDLKAPRGQEVLRRLVQRSDVLVENFRPGTMARLGMTYEQAAALRPDLVYCSVSGFGQTGPRSQQPAYDQILQGMGGVMSLTGAPDGVPTKVGIPIADICAGMFAAYAIALALFHRERGGGGQYVDTSMLGGQAALLTFQAARLFANGTPPGRGGNRHPTIAPYESFQAADGWVNVACGNEGMWQRFCEALGLRALRSDPRFATNADRVRHREELSTAIQAEISRHSVADVVRTLGAAEVPVGPVFRLDELFADPQAEHLELRREIEHPRVGRLAQTGFPYRLSRTPPELRLPPPLLGQHTDEILAELGYEASEARALRDDGIV